VPHDPTKAIDLYKKAATQNVVAAQLRLGEIYLHGDLVAPDFTQAKRYLERAAYHGDPRAAMLLGQMYRLGLGMSADPIEAYAWSEVASLEGSVFAKRERDASLGKLDADKQQEAVARATKILAQIKHEMTAASVPASK
jgi:TPR repeat protein